MDGVVFGIGEWIEQFKLHKAIEDGRVSYTKAAHLVNHLNVDRVDTPTLVYDIQRWLKESIVHLQDETLPPLSADTGYFDLHLLRHVWDTEGGMQQQLPFTTGSPLQVGVHGPRSGNRSPWGWVDDSIPHRA